MALSHVTKVFGIKSAKITKLTADVAGSATTYAAQSIVVPGAKELILTPEFQSKELRGDNTVLDVDSVLTGLKGTLKHGKFSFDVLNALTGATVTDTGVTPGQQTKATIQSSNATGYFKLECQAVDVDAVAGDMHYVVWKAKALTLPIGLAEEDYELFSFDFIGAPQLGTGLSWFDVLINETAVAIP